MKEKKKDRELLSSTFVRIVAFFLLAISFITGVAGIIGTTFLLEAEVYTKGTTSLIHNYMTSYVWEDVGYVKALYQEGDIGGIEAYLSKRNASIEIYDINVPENEENILLWSNYDGTETKHSYNCFTEVNLKQVQEPETVEMYVFEEDIMEDDIDVAEEGNEDFNTSVYSDIADKEMKMAEEEITVNKELLFRVYIDDTFPYEDEYSSVYKQGMLLEKFIYVIPVVAVISVFLFLVSFIYLMCSAGHHHGKEGITGGVLYFFHFDIVTAIFGVGAVLLLVGTFGLLNYGDLIGYVLAMACAALEIIWCTIYCMEFATELKKGTIFKHTLIYAIMRRLAKSVKVLCCGMIDVVHGLPLVMNVVLAYIAFCIVQFTALVFFWMLWNMDSGVLVLCVLEKFILFPVVLYFALLCKKLQAGSEALAEGNLSYKLDTSKMLFGFKEHGENLNRIGDGISVAVEERMRSEHLKTELITNVSHDLKTPLTSIINYADLIGTVVKSEITTHSENNENSRNNENSKNGENSENREEGSWIEEKNEEKKKKQLAEYSEVLVRQSRRLKKLLEDLVEASKATTGNLEVNLVPCEISVLLSQAVGEYELRFAEKQLELIVRQPEEPISIQADGRHIWRVFDNLMNNICKYAQENTRVYLTVEPKEDYVEIVFRNMSKYPLEISAEELQERFVRGDKSRHMEGNGLGLSIAGSLVDLQNGKMEIVTDGDLFKVILRFPVL